MMYSSNENLAKLNTIIQSSSGDEAKTIRVPPINLLNVGTVFYLMANFPFIVKDNRMK